MESICYKEFCKDNAIYACDCNNQIKFYFCENHRLGHLNEAKIHNISPILVSISDEESADILQKSLLVIDLLSKLRLKSSDESNLIIKKTLELHNFYCGIITKIEKSIKSLFVNIKNKKNIDKNSYILVNKIDKLNKSNNFFNNPVSVILKNITGVDIINNEWNNESIFYVDHLKQLKIIDLISLKTEIPAWTKNYNFGYCSSCCKISENNYFLYGGVIKNTDRRNYLCNGYFLDFKANRCINIPSYIACCSAGSTFNSKNNSIYIFGGFNGNVLLDDCHKFDLNDKKWSYLCKLPNASVSCTASFVYSKIVLTGRDLNGLFFFNTENNMLVKILKLSCVNKYSFENFVLTADGELYEDTGNFKFNLTRIQMPLFCCDLSLFTYFKKNYFIFFIDKNGTILRIDTLKKKLSEIKKL